MVLDEIPVSSFGLLLDFVFFVSRILCFVRVIVLILIQYLSNLKAILASLLLDITVNMFLRGIGLDRNIPINCFSAWTLDPFFTFFFDILICWEYTISFKATKTVGLARGQIFGRRIHKASSLLVWYQVVVLLMTFFSYYNSVSEIKLSF